MNRRQKRYFFPQILGWMLALLLCMTSVSYAEEGTADLVIFHTNDMHARIKPVDDGGKSIGLAEITAAVKAERAKNPDVLWLDAGDTFHGMPDINISRGENLVSLLNLAGVDAMVPGNHDFNYGSEQLERLAKKLKFPVLSANVARKGSGELLFPAYRIYDLPNGIRVGIFGLTTPETAYKTSPKNVTAVEFLNPVATARKMIRELKPQCDVLIAIMHMGVDKSSEFTSERIAREAPGINLIVDGHSHTALPEGLQEGDTLIVQTGWHEYRLGRVTIHLQDGRITAEKAQLLDKKDVKRMAPKPDGSIEKALANMEKHNKKLFGKVVAHTSKSLTSDRLILRRRESELGNLSADALRWRTGADIAVINGGGMRSDLPEGAVTYGDCLAIFPFGNTIRKAEIRGSVIRAMLEHSVYAYPASFGGFLSVSGMTFQFDPTRPAGMRVGEIRIQGEALDENRVYTIGATDFMFDGGDDYKMLKDLPIVGEYDTCEQVLADYLNRVGAQGIEMGRIIFLKDVPASDELPDGAAAEAYKKAA